MVSIDVTDLLDHVRHVATLTGIQRVMVNITRELVAGYGTEAVDLVAYDRKQKRFLRTSARYFLEADDHDQARFCEHFGRTPAAPPPGSFEAHLRARHRSRWKRHLAALHLRLYNFISQGRAFRRRGIVERPAIASSLPPTVWRDADFRAGDQIVVMGAAWSNPGYLAALDACRKTDGVRIVHFIHDLTPLVTPECFPAGQPARFETWLREVLAASDLLLTNSHATARDLGRFVDASGGAATPTAVVQLAHEFLVPPAKAGVPMHLRGFELRSVRHREWATPRTSTVTLEPYALVVGTVEPRKNVLRVLQIWKRLLDRHGLVVPKLVIAGKAGWLSDDIWNLLRVTGNLGGKVEFVDGPDDAELGFLYANSLFLVYVSRYEGWGLPIGESMWFGRPVLASSSSSMPEVGRDLIDYCDPDDVVGIEAGLERLMFDAEHRSALVAGLETARLRTWKDVAYDLWAAVSGEVSKAES